MNKQVKAALSAVRDFISGHSGEAKVADANDLDLRKEVAAELLAAMGRGNEQDRGEAKVDQAGQEESMRDAQEDRGEVELRKEQERSRQLFMEHGYFDEAVQNLRAGKSAADRAAAARALGLVGSQRGTAHLIAAMFDDDPEVRSAAGEALNQIGDPTVANAPTTEMPMTENPPPSHAPEAFEHEVETTSIGADDIATTQLQEDVLADTPPAANAESEAEGKSATYDELQVEQANPPAIVDDSAAATEEEQLLLEEHAVRETVEQYERQLIESAALRQKAENEARWRAEREAKIRGEAEGRRVEEEEQRKRAEEEAARRRYAELEALASEQTARQEAEAEVHRLAEEETRLRLESSKLRRAADELARQRRQIETARREAAESARHAEATRARQEAEKRHQFEVERLQNEEQALHFAVEETNKRRSELESSRHNAESEIASLTEERNQLIAAAEDQIRKLAVEREQLFTAESARRAEAERLRREAEERKRSEEEQLQQQLDTLSKVTQEIAARRAEIGTAREKAEKEAEQLAESLARMRAAEEARDRAEQERLQIEAATDERVQMEQRLLDEARRRALEEQARLDEEKRRHDEAEEQRMAALEAVHRKTEFEARQRAEKEKQIHAEIDHMRIADAEVRRRIEEAESLRRASEQAYRVAAEKVQRIEAEAHATALQEEQILSKLEGVRRNVAGEAQARADQEKRIKEEIEQLRRLQDEERPRLEGAILQRAAAAARLQQMRESRPEVSTRAEGQHQVMGASVSGAVAGASREDETVRSNAPTTSLRDDASGVGSEDLDAGMDHELPALEGGTLVQPAVDSYLNSLDPYKRAAAVGEVARSQGKDSFAVIAQCFDDPSPFVRNAAARALCQLEPARTVDFFNRALEEGSEERRRNIGSAIAGSRLAAEAIDKLASESREDTYNALSILFVMAKTGEVDPLVRAIEEHDNDEVRKAVIKLLTLSGQIEIADAAMKRRETS
ncbi:MAG: HEAT repeat domain-containing protein [Acidobacteriota bacterium]